MSNSFYTGTANTFWDTYAVTGVTGITFSAPQMQLLTSQYRQLVAQVDRNGQLQLANAAYWARVAQEAREAHERAMREWEEQRHRHRKEQEEIDKRALQLAKDVLTEDEFALFSRDQYVFVTNKKSKKEYKVRLHGTVLQWRANKAHISICIVPDYGHAVPAIDLFLSQYLLCKYDERTLLTIGRKHPC